MVSPSLDGPAAPIRLTPRQRQSLSTLVTLARQAEPRHRWNYRFEPPCSRPTINTADRSITRCADRPDVTERRMRYPLWASVLTDRRCRQCRAEQAILYCGTGELVIDMKPILGRPHSHPGSTSLSVISRVPWLSRADPPRSARLRKTRRRRVTTTRLSGFGPQLVRSPAAEEPVAGLLLGV